MDIVLNPGTSPVEGATSDNARRNIEQFVRDIIEGFPVTRVAVQRGPDAGEDGRFGFSIGVFLSEPAIERALTLEVDMPGLPLGQVNYGARPDDDIWHFPRLYVDGSSAVWPYAVEMCRAEIEEAVADRDDKVEQTTLMYGYSQGILDEQGLAGAWGGVARVTRDGTVELIEERQDEFGDDSASLATLLGKLDDGLEDRWIAQARRLLTSGDMKLDEDREFVLLDEDGITVKANTHGSCGHLYVRAGIA